MSRSLIVQHWTFHTAHKHAPNRQDYSPYDLNGMDLLSFIQGVTKPGESIDNVPRKRWTRIDSVASRGGRAIVVTAASGRYGEPGDLVNRTSGTVDFRIGEEHAPTAPTRSLIVVPDSGLHALAFYERSSSAGISGVELFSLLWKRRFLDAHTGITWEPDWIDEPEVWLEEARLKAVEVRRYNGNLNTSSADSDLPDEFIYAARARSGRFFGQGTLESVLKNAGRVHKMVGVQPVDNDRVLIEVKVGDRQVKYRLDGGALPKLQRELSDGLTEDQFVGECLGQADRMFDGLGVKWVPSWIV